MGLITFDDALTVIARLVEVAGQRHERLGTPIVAVGGTAMAAWGIRDLSRDVDLYMPEVPAESVEAVEQEFKRIHGKAFRLDVTSGENIWGAILVRDIAGSPRIETAVGVELRALGPADLFLLKLASGRERDRDDLALIAPRTSEAELVARWNQLVKWHGDRQAILGFADAFVAQLVMRFRAAPRAVIARLDVTDGQRRLLDEAHAGDTHEPR